MFIPWEVVLVVVVFVVVLDEIRIVRYKNKIKTLEKYISKYNDSLKDDAIK